MQMPEDCVTNNHVYLTDDRSTSKVLMVEISLNFNQDPQNLAQELFHFLLHLRLFHSKFRRRLRVIINHLLHLNK